MKKFIFVLKSRESGVVYLSSTLYDGCEIQHFAIHLDSIGVDVVDVIPIGIKSLPFIDLSQYK